MRKLYLLACICIIINANSQSQTKADTAKYWKKGGFAALNFNQVSLSNWAAGGESSVSLTALGNAFANYKKGKTNWDNSLDLGYGIIKTGDDPLRKNEDKIDLNSKYGQLAKGKFYYSALINFKSQFAKGYNYPNDSVVVSRFFAPAYLIISIGMDYKPHDYLSIYLSPATGRYIFVNDTRLSEAGAYGVEKGKKVRAEFGAYFTARFQKDIMKNINLMTKLSLFDNYTDKDESNRTNIDVNWEMLIGMKVNKYISASIFTNLVYDHNITIPTFKTIEGVKTAVGKGGPKTQFKEVLGIGLSYKF
jgi:hypothetical protein